MPGDASRSRAAGPAPARACAGSADRSAPMARRRGELVVPPPLREVQAGRDPDDHQPDAARGRREVHADGQALRQLRERRLDRLRPLHVATRDRTRARSARAAGPSEPVAHTSSSVMPGSGTASSRSRSARVGHDHERRVRDDARGTAWRPRSDGARSAALPERDRERVVRPARPRSSDTSAGIGAGCGIKPAKTLPCADLHVEAESVGGGDEVPPAPAPRQRKSIPSNRERRAVDVDIERSRWGTGTAGPAACRRAA